MEVILSVEGVFQGKVRYVYGMGGTRRGAGRPRNPIKRIGRTIRLSDEEFLSLKPLIMAIKANNDKRYRQQYNRNR